MASPCRIGLHRWNGCVCARCGRTRDKEHARQHPCSECVRCRAPGAAVHDWRDHRCAVCGAIDLEPILAGLGRQPSAADAANCRALLAGGYDEARHSVHNYHQYRRDGISLCYHAKTDRLIGVRVFLGDGYNFTPFAGPLPRGIPAGATRAELEARFGPPEPTNDPEIRYPRRGICLRFDPDTDPAVARPWQCVLTRGIDDDFCIACGEDLVPGLCVQVSEPMVRPRDAEGRPYGARCFVCARAYCWDCAKAHIEAMLEQFERSQRYRQDTFPDQMLVTSVMDSSGLMYCPHCERRLSASRSLIPF